MKNRHGVKPGSPADGGSATATSSLTPAVAELKRRLGVSPAPRMLTSEEIELLRKSAKEVAEVTRQVLAADDSRERQRHGGTTP